LVLNRLVVLDDRLTEAIVEAGVLPLLANLFGADHPFLTLEDRSECTASVALSVSIALCEQFFAALQLFAGPTVERVTQVDSQTTIEVGPNNGCEYLSEYWPEVDIPAGIVCERLLERLESSTCAEQVIREIWSIEYLWPRLGPEMQLRLFSAVAVFGEYVGSNDTGCISRVV